MIEGKLAVFLYQKDFTDKGLDRYFLYHEGFFEEKNIAEILSFDGVLITHDYWLIAPSIYKFNSTLPKVVIDVTELAKFIIGTKQTPETIQKTSIKSLIKKYYTDKKDLLLYFENFYRKSDLNFESYQLFAHHLLSCWEKLAKKTERKDESIRFFEVELPIFNLITKVANKGVRIDHEQLREYKANIDFDFYRELKAFALDFNLFFEVPTDKDLEGILIRQGIDLNDNSAKFIVEFMPMAGEFGKRYNRLKKLKKSRTTLANMPLSKTRACPIAETHSTVTSRIYYKNPTIQNLSKKYRNIFIPDDGFSLSYVDYDQFEVGIMAALSKDENLKSVYMNNDVYTKFASDVFNDVNKRSISKKLFLAFTYGMSLSKILQSVYEQGGQRLIARQFFDEFHVFNEWKQSIENSFQQNGKISSLLGNYLRRKGNGALTNKEKRSCISHVVQGTGSLIFKKALLNLDLNPEIEILIPMHDAVLVQHVDGFNIATVIETFQETMDSVLGDFIAGKASIENFYAQ